MAELKYGYVGKILRVDLTTGAISTVPTSNYAPKFIGGRSIAAKIYWDEVMPEVKAFDPENRLIMMTGPNGGTLAPSSSRIAVVSKSPTVIPETYLYSIPGSGDCSAHLKFAGYDGIIIQGKAPEPVYLWIHDGEAEIKPCGYLWGALTSKVDEELKRLHGLQAKTIVIGPAGENLVQDSVIELEGHSAAGHGGFGAVMGSKNLKAIAIRGRGSVKVARPKELMDLYEYVRILSPPGSNLRAFSFAFPVDKETWLTEEIEKGNATRKAHSCFSCPEGCRAAMRFKSLEVPNGSQQCNDLIELQLEDYLRTGKYFTTDGWEWGRLCDDLGLSATNVIGHLMAWFTMAHHGGTWATELVWAGLWTEENTGLPVGSKEGAYTEKCPKLGVGSKEFNRALLHKVAYREGIGDLIAEGQQRYLKHVVETAPPELKEIAQEIYDKSCYIEEFHSIWHPRHCRKEYWNVLLQYPTGLRKGVGLEMLMALKEANAIELFGSENGKKAVDRATPEYKVPYVIFAQNQAIEADSLTWCDPPNSGFPCYSSATLPDGRGDLALGAKLFSAVTGIDMTFDEMLQVGERTFNLERAIAVREGRRKEHDVYNDYQFEKGRQYYPDGPLLKDYCSKELFTTLMDEYYTLRGWDLETGIPTRSKLEELDLKDVADDLEKKYGVTVPAQAPTIVV
jgi:aldehyde:ferredoxin oxidoreductase